MTLLAPTFSLTAGRLRSTTAAPVGGPSRLIVTRDMDVAADGLRVWLVDRSGVTLADPVTLALGYAGDEQTVFTGSVVALRPTIVGVELQALGPIDQLLRLRLAATYQNQSVGGIIRALIRDTSLTAGTIADGPLLPTLTLDRRQSVYAYLKELADRLGYELYADRDGRLMCHALGDAGGLDAGGLASAVGAALGLTESTAMTFGQQIVTAVADRRPAAWSTAAVGGESPMSGQGDTTAHWLTINDTDYRGQSGSGEPSGLWLDALARTKDLADRFAAGRLAVAARQAHTIRLRLLGQPQIDLGATLSAADLPDALSSGSGYVRAITHRLDATHGYVTDLRLAVSSA